ncbi:hypothetical protein ACXR2U_07540 [Jatrophihabitans sp. YIM 134969]
MTKRVPAPPPPVDDLLAYKVGGIFEELHDLGRTPGSARAAESAACDLISTVVDHRPDQWAVLLELLGSRPDPLTCALYTAMSLVLTGPRRVEVARRAARMRCDLLPQPWMDHIGAAPRPGVPPGNGPTVTLRSGCSGSSSGSSRWTTVSSGTA